MSGAFAFVATEYIASFDVIRDEAIGKSETYENKAVQNKDCSVLKHAKATHRKMPIYNKHIAQFIAENQSGAIPACLGLSFVAKIASQDNMADAGSIAKYAKTKNREGFHDIHYVIELALTNPLWGDIS